MCVSIRLEKQSHLVKQGVSSIPRFSITVSSRQKKTVLFRPYLQVFSIARQRFLNLCVSKYKFV